MMRVQQSRNTNQQQQSGPRHRGLGGVVEKPKNFKATWQALIRYCKRYIPAIIFALVIANVASIVSILAPNQLGNLADAITRGLPEVINHVPVVNAIDFEAITRIVLMIALFHISAMLLNYLQGFLMATITQRISQKMRSEIAQKLNKLPLKYFDGTSHGDVLSRVTNDVDTIGETMNQSIGGLVTSATLFIGTAIMMIYNSWILAIVAFISTSFGFIGMRFLIKKSQPQFIRQQRDLGVVNGHIEEIFSGHHVVKSYNAGKEAKKVFEKINEDLYDSAWRGQFLSGLMMPFMMFVGNFGFVSVCVIGAVLAVNGVIPFGAIVAFMIYIRLFTQPLSQIAQALQNMQRTAAAGERVFELLNETELEDEREKTKVLENVKGDIEFRHVKFGYDPENLIIKNFSASISAGQKIAIVGPTGAGKTTIVNLLMRFYELNDGEISIDGIPISQVTRENVHDQFCMVLQDSWLFEGTIKENIVYAMTGITDEQVVEVCKAVGMHHFIRSLPEGYDTILNDKASLSQGQKQLLTIARAMIQNAPMLILDEATSSVDTRTEHLVQEAMDKLTVGRTSFVIAHRLSTIKNADVILVMNEGDIIESGNHTSLLEQGGFYADLYNSQFENV